jgi:hypothetical protein
MAEEIAEMEKLYPESYGEGHDDDDCIREMTPSLENKTRLVSRKKRKAELLRSLNNLIQWFVVPLLMAVIVAWWVSRSSEQVLSVVA